MIHLRESVEDIHALINKTADAYQSAGHVTGSELDSAAYHARFLRRLTAMHQEQRARQQTERSVYRPEGVPPSFAQGKISNCTQVAFDTQYPSYRPSSDSHVSAVHRCAGGYILCATFRSRSWIWIERATSHPVIHSRLYQRRARFYPELHRLRLGHHSS